MKKKNPFREPLEKELGHEDILLGHRGTHSGRLGVLHGLFVRLCGCHQTYIYMQDASSICPILSAGSGLWRKERKEYIASLFHLLSLPYFHSCVACSMPCFSTTNQTVTPADAGY